MVQAKDYKFVLKEDLLFAEYCNANYNKTCIYLPEFIAALVLNRTQLFVAQGLSRTQLLFSPMVQISGMPNEKMFMIQENSFR